MNDIIRNYNNTVHSGTRFKPNDVNKLNEIEVYRNLYKLRTPVEKNKLQIGDRVRLAMIRGPFAKGYLPNYTEEIFDIYKIYQTSPKYKYRVRDRKGNIIRGSFYKEELLKINV